MTKTTTRYNCRYCPLTHETYDEAINCLHGAILVGSPEYEALKRRTPVWEVTEFGTLMRNGVPLASFTADHMDEDQVRMIEARIVELLTIYGE